MVETRRETYFFNQLPEETSSLWSFLLDFLKPLISEAFVDAYPAPVWGERFTELPEPARRAHETLTELGQSQGTRRDLLMAVRVVPDEAAWEALRNFGPHSIHVELHTQGVSDPILVNHDSGGIYARLTDQEFASLLQQARDAGLDLDSITEKEMPRKRRRSIKSWFKSSQ